MANLINNNVIILHRPKYDKSTKPWEIIKNVYTFNKYTRKLRSNSQWVHHKYYSSLESAEDAIKSFREHPPWDRDYPAMGNIENEKRYPHLEPRIKVVRYAIRFRKEI